VADGTGIGTILDDDSAPGPTLTLGTSAGPPKSKFAVSGANFGPNELVDLYFDTSDQRLVSTNGAGAFSGAQLTVPGDAQPGQHWVTAAGRSSGLSAQAAFTVRSDWSAYGAGPRHQGVNPTENTVGPNNASGLDLGWSTPISGAITTTPTVAGGLVYFGSSTFSGANFFLYAADASTGAIAWSVALPINPNDKSQPAAAGGRVYVGSSGKMEAIDTTTHSVACFAAAGSTLRSAPEVSGGVVYFGADGGTLYAMDATTCAISWSVGTGSAITGSPAVAGGVVWVPSGNNLKGYLVAAPHTNTVTVATGGPVTSPAAAAGYVFMGAGDNTVRAVRASDGSSVWSVTLGSPVVAGPAVIGGTVFVGTSDGHLYALSASTGATKWTATTGGAIAGTPAVANGVVYAGSADKNVYAFDASNGTLLWQGGTGGGVTGAAVANGQVFVGSVDKSLYAFSLGGQKRPGHQRPDPATLRPDMRLRPAA
jgi:outer membrane protein assembly factor BamB